MKHVKTDGRYGRYGKIQPEEICAGVPDRDGNGLLDGGVDSCGGTYIKKTLFILRKYIRRFGWPVNV
mgnify:CR=1 FL=1